MQCYRSVMALIVAALLLTGAEAAWAGWGLPSLNPFSGNEKPEAKKDDGGGWSLPKLPGLSRKPKRSDQKSVLTRTKETLFPWTKPKPAPTKITGARRSYEHQAKFASQKGKQGKSFFSSWFQDAEDQPQAPLSPHEWLGQPRPE